MRSKDGTHLEETVLMSVIDEVLTANASYAKTHRLAGLSPRPRRRLAVLTCMDTRLSKHTLGLAVGDAHIMRNAGGIVTDDVVRSLLVSHFLLGTEAFMIINHTDCGLAGVTEEELHRRIRARSGTTTTLATPFYAFTDVHENVRRQLERLRSHPSVPTEIAVRGFVYDVNDGRLHEVFP
jgi:carbonic anhydrase